MNKKLLASLLCATTLLSLAACSSSSSSEDTTAADTTTETTEAADSDLAYIQGKGTLVVGITDFAPMDYKEEGSSEWIGFDVDMAKEFAADLGVDVEFIEINWDNKLLELESKGIDVVWNGMTITEEITNGATASEAYCNNGQVVIVKSDVADQYQTVESLADLTFAVEAGSAGAMAVEDAGLNSIAVTTQAMALMEVAAGTSDACVIDSLMAGAMIGEGTSYDNLTYTIQLTSEEYGVAFRADSDMGDVFNAFWKDAYDAGTVMEVAETYGVQAAIIEK